jgi:hypothetical protein
MTTEITGADLLTLQGSLGFGTADMCNALAISITKWSQLINMPKEQVSDPALCILIRLLYEYPELSIVQPLPKAQEIYNLLVEINPNFTKANFSALLGVDKSAAARWLRNEDSNPSPQIKRMFFAIDRKLRASSAIDKKIFLQYLTDNATTEAQSRGVNIKDGVWKTREAILASKQSQAVKDMYAKKAAAKTHSN